MDLGCVYLHVKGTPTKLLSITRAKFLEDLMNNTLCLEKSVMYHVAIYNYSSNYMNICSIITIIIIKIGTRHCLLRFKETIKPPTFQKKTNKERRLRMPRIICYENYYIDMNHQRFVSETLESIYAS